VGPGRRELGTDGVVDGTFTATLSAPGGRTITRLALRSSAPGSWDTDAATSAWILGVATTLDSALLNDPGNAGVNVPVPDGGVFQLFAPTLPTASSCRALSSPWPPPSPTERRPPRSPSRPRFAPPPLTLKYEGKLRDRVGPSNLGLAADGALDGTLTATLTATGGRTITRLQLQSSAPRELGHRRHQRVGPGCRRRFDAPLLNNPVTMAVNFTVPDGGGGPTLRRRLGRDRVRPRFEPHPDRHLLGTGTTATAVTVASVIPSVAHARLQR